MKTKLFCISLFVTLLLSVQSLYAQNVRYKKMDREHWRNLKEGLRYDRQGKHEDYNRRWSDKFDERTDRKKRGSGGFGKYSRRNRGGDGSGDGSGEGNGDDNGGNTNTRERELIEDEPESSGGSISFPGLPAGLSYILLGIAIVALSYIIYRMLAQADWKRKRKVEPVAQEQDSFEETFELPKSELQQRLEAALQNQQYREAIRIWFIFIIKSLREKSWIIWERKKTNTKYLSEMRERGQFSMFSQCVSIFEIVWYGKRELTKEEYLQIEPLFRNLMIDLEGKV